MKKTKKLTWLFKQILFLAVLLLPSLAFADGGGDSPIGSGLSWIVNLMYGSTGVYLATIAIAGMGIACYFHVFEWIRFIQTVIGVSIVFGAGAIVTAIQTLTHSS